VGGGPAEDRRAFRCRCASARLAVASCPGGANPSGGGQRPLDKASMRRSPMLARRTHWKPATSTPLTEARIPDVVGPARSAQSGAVLCAAGPAHPTPPPGTRPGAPGL